MTVFYRGPCAHITHKVFETHRPSFRQFAISGLANVHIVCDSSYELRAHYGGTIQVLFACTDSRVFGQVSRALLRALEYYADTN